MNNRGGQNKNRVKQSHARSGIFWIIMYRPLIIRNIRLIAPTKHIRHNKLHIWCWLMWFICFDFVFFFLFENYSCIQWFRVPILLTLYHWYETILFKDAIEINNCNPTYRVLLYSCQLISRHIGLTVIISIHQKIGMMCKACRVIRDWCNCYT